MDGARTRSAGSPTGREAARTRRRVASLRVGFVLAATSLAAAAAVAAQQPTRVTARDIVAMIEEGRLSRAEKLLRVEVERGGPPLAGYLLGHVLVEQFRFEEAEALLRTAVEQRPDRAPWRFDLARALVGEGRCAAAIVELDACIALKPEPSYRYDKAMCALNNGDETTAESELLAALAGGWESAEAWFKLGRLRADRGEDATARDAFDRALELDPDHLEATFGLGLIESRAGDGERAIEHFRAVLRRVPGHVGAAYNLARVLLRAGRTDEGRAAMAEFQRASAMQELIENHRAYLQHFPTDLAARVALGRLLLQAGRPAEASQVLEEAVRLGAVDDSLFALLAESYRLEGRPADAARAARRAGNAPS
jgi:tetratricopeptide (TPR) repeat protein